VDAIPLEVLVGPALVVEVEEGHAVTAGAIAAAGLPEGAQRVLFKTRNGDLWDRPRFQRRFVHIDEEAARALVTKGVRLVGIDYLSAEQYGARQPVTHRVLLGAGVVILEGIDLRGVAPGAYTLVCLPLKVTGGDGAPARAILMTEDTPP
jgi:arylformamidase